METSETLSFEAIQLAATRLGFPLVGVTAAQESPGFARFCQWLDQGYAGSMEYLDRRREAYRHPASVLDGVQSLIMLGMPYQPADSRRHANPHGNEPTSGFGQTAAYASGTVDYHDLIHERLRLLTRELIARCPGIGLRGVVDTAPLLEREFASLAGLGWIGKNTLLLSRGAGSYFFLAALLSDRRIDHPPSTLTDHCGTCTACLDACPTQAFPKPGVLDATRCISYLTIEHRESISPELRPAIGSWLFGCDVCQQVCPWNRMANPTREVQLEPAPEIQRVDLLKLLAMDEAAFRLHYRKTPFWRARLLGMQRNAMIVLGNQRHPEAYALLVDHLSGPHVVLRQTAAWALGRLGTLAAQTALQSRLPLEPDTDVRKEIVEAVESSPHGNTGQS